MCMGGSKPDIPKPPPPPKPSPPQEPVESVRPGSRRRSEESNRRSKKTGTSRLRIGLNLPGSSGSSGTNLPGSG